MDKPRINWVEGGIVIAIVAILDAAMAVIDFLCGFLVVTIVIAFVVNLVILFTSLLSLSLWLLLRRSITWGRAIALWQLLISGFIPFAMTTTMSIMIARIIGGKVVAKIAPGAAGAVAAAAVSGDKSPVKAAIGATKVGDFKKPERLAA